MARTFDQVNENFLETTDVPSGYPLTMACWFNPDSTIDEDNDLMTVQQVNSANNFHHLVQESDDSTLQYNAREGGAATRSAATTNTAGAGSWHHACAIGTSATDRRVVLNGDWANSGTNTTDATPASLGQTHIAGLLVANDNPNHGLDGDLAEAAIWSVALVQAEVEALANGVSPLLIRPDQLWAYWKLYGRESPERDYWAGGHDLTLVNAGHGQADHVPGIIYPARQHPIVVPSAAPPAAGRLLLINPPGIEGGFQSGPSHP